MKILYASTYNTLSGANRSLLALLVEQRKMGNEVAVITPHIKHDHTEIYEAIRKLKVKQRVVYSNSNIKPKGVEYPLQIVVKNKIKDLLAECQTIIFMLSFKPDIFHINTLSSCCGYYAAKLLNIPIVWHIREFIEEDNNFEFVESQKEIKMLQRADAVIAISNSICEKFQKRLGRNNINIIYNGIDVKQYLINEAHAFLNMENISIIIAGRLIPGKGQKDAILAIQELYRKGFKNIKLNIYGGEATDEYLAELKRIIKKGCGEIYLCGIEKDMPSVYKKSDILLVCSKNEPFGRVTLEGMLGGCLVIGADTAGTKELINDNVNGLLYREGNYIDLARRIEDAITNVEDMKRIIANGQKWTQEKFTSALNAAKINEIYKKVRRTHEIKQS